MDVNAAPASDVANASAWTPSSTVEGPTVRVPHDARGERDACAREPLSHGGRKRRDAPRRTVSARRPSADRGLARGDAHALPRRTAAPRDGTAAVRQSSPPP